VPGRLRAVDEVVGVVLERSTDNERSLPRGGQLVLARRLLNSAEHQVAFTKGEGADLLAVVVPQLLLIYCRSGQSQQACFFF